MLTRLISVSLYFRISPSSKPISLPSTQQLTIYTTPALQKTLNKFVKNAFISRQGRKERIAKNIMKIF